MSGLTPLKDHSSCAVSKKSELENPSGMTDIHRIKNWIQKVIGEEKNKPLSQEQKEKIKILWSSLRKIAGSNEEVSDPNLNSPIQREDDCNVVRTNDDTKQIFNLLRKKLSNPHLQQHIESKTEQNGGIDPNLQSESLPTIPGTAIREDDDIDIFHSDMAKLSKSITELCRIISIPGIKKSHSQLEKILSKMENIAKECSLQSVENNWKGALQHFKKLDFKNLHEKINTLSCQMNVMQCTFDKNNNGFAASGIDEKLVSIVNSTHNLLSLLKLLNEKISTKGVLSFDTKLSEIKTAVEKNRKYAQSYTQKFVEKFEKHLESIGAQVQDIHSDVREQQKPAKPRLDLIEKIGERLGNLESHVANIMLKLEERQNTSEDPAILRNLENQLLNIKDLVTNDLKDNRTLREPDQHVFGLEDYIVKTAHKTARSMLNSINKSQDIERILQKNMHEYCKEIQKVHAEQTIKNFTTLYDMLVKIFQKLGTLTEEGRRLPYSTSNDLSPNHQASHKYSELFKNLCSDNTPSVNQTRVESNTYNEQYPILSSNNSLDQHNHPHDISETQGDSVYDQKKREKEFNSPHDIQHMLERVSLIQQGILEDDNTIPTYISAVRRATSTSTMRSNDLKEKNIGKKIWNFTKYITSNQWVTSIMLVATLLVSSFLLSPALLVRETFFFKS
ncbi:hypothetical protein [Candidatus Liberibacter asiaticus]|uniref:Putative peptidoglycan binding protein n=1 Tax=Liberibacter asiaticus (strain psy62) TaxID=537021 RepID=C6XEY4_LIBAP|nr:hypothetical protein [Candidatus Liberibacter asiaticus]ACT56936.1 putative peptidoglycan binding protein [Candidatus Liberibacter asiaticus str. psy62]KAE9510326.1 hypothetical protein FXW22_01600 [Candidatus Liberibacter asiaticus]KAE9511087.1 hypothetical protein FXW31_03250 [Candidatus Liberibacter asiaticus]KAE9512458.1 hypothetical protein FXW32_01730 [Candidatus Liberibacter asiaticus]KAE9513538.1 hypothetical protein FXW35_01615 [Candidatus Liberibacter asiaticus]